nr:S-protein homolog 29-like [Ipomoea batatas]
MVAEVHIQNKLSGELKFHCKAKGNDLGPKTISKTAEFTWKFGLHLVGKTIYSCEFEWGKKHAGFDVFSEDFAKANCPTYNCVWVVKEDGFYMGNKILQHWK